MSAPSRSRPFLRLDGIDLLRGAAIFCVLMNHVNMRLFLAEIPYTEGLPRQLVSSLVWSGQYGVQVFFAVSGFLITSMSLRRWGALEHVDVRRFYILRFARIAPLLLALLAVLSALHIAGAKNFVVNADTGGLFRALLAALTFHVNWLEATRNYLPANWDVLWSLSVEEVFYIAFPLLCRLPGGRWSRRGLLMSLIVLGPFARTVFAHGNEVWQEYSYFGGMDAIALGCSTAIVLPGIRIARAQRLALGSAGILVMVSVVGNSRAIQASMVGRCGLDMTLLAIGACLAMVAMAESRWQCPRLLAPLLYLGRYSYEVYLTHMFVVFGLFDTYIALGASVRAVPRLFAGVIVLAGLLGVVVARAYSEPMNRLLKEF